MRIVISVCILSFTLGCSLGPEKPDDQDVWIYSNPESTGISDSTILVLDENIRNNVYRNVNSLIVIKDDQLVFENYYDFSFRERQRNIGQASLSVLIIALDLLMRDGYIQNIQQSIADFLPEYQSIFVDDPEKETITIEHLLTNRSGLAWIQSNSFPDNVNDLNLMKLKNDWVEYVLSRPLEASPGLRYIVNSGAGVVLARVMENALGSDLLTYLQEELFNKISIKEFTWEKDPNGTLDGGTGLHIKTLDLAKFGYLLLNGGRWKKARIISNEWIFSVTKANIQLDDTLNTGYGWWSFTDGTIELEVNDLFFAAGGIGQQLYVVPHLKMVVAINAENYGQGFFNNSTFIFLSILASLESNLN
ncbi:MAG: serine hydrolase domain-containing protein [Bacteroidota bacterium]